MSAACGPEPEDSWHFKRTCVTCGKTWYGLHCPHDGYQKPCPSCGKRPTPVDDPGGDCGCAFDSEPHPCEDTDDRSCDGPARPFLDRFGPPSCTGTTRTNTITAYCAIYPCTTFEGFTCFGRWWGRTPNVQVKP